MEVKHYPKYGQIIAKITGSKAAQTLGKAKGLYGAANAKLASAAEKVGWKSSQTKIMPKAFEAEDVIMRPLLPGEGKVGNYGELFSERTKGSGLAAHHMPNSQYMQSKGIPHAEGISMMVEHPIPGIGGRHREIHKELARQDPVLAPREALAQSAARAREVYKADGVLPEIRSSLLEVIDANKKKFPELFQKGAKK